MSSPSTASATAQTGSCDIMLSTVCANSSPRPERCGVFQVFLTWIETMSSVTGLASRVKYGASACRSAGMRAASPSRPGEQPASAGNAADSERAGAGCGGAHLARRVLDGPLHDVEAVVALLRRQRAGHVQESVAQELSRHRGHIARVDGRHLQRLVGELLDGELCRWCWAEVGQEAAQTAGGGSHGGAVKRALSCTRG